MGSEKLHTTGNCSVCPKLHACTIQRGQLAVVQAHTGNSNGSSSSMTTTAQCYKDFGDGEMDCIACWRCTLVQTYISGQQ